MAIAIATWTVGVAALHELAKNCEGSAVDCVDLVVSSIKTVEDDPATGCYVVGRGGFPNSAGVCEFDAAIMRGADCAFAGVGALQSIATPIAVARSVLDCSPHSLLTGEGAKQFAVSQGYVCEPEHVVQQHQVVTQARDVPLPGHAVAGKDTLCVIVKDKHGNIAAGGSSSGKPYKHPGRIGDVPLPGCGLYADTEAGAACCTGDGDSIARFCPAFQVVQLMSEGLSPEASCSEVVRRIESRLSRCGASMFDIGIIAMSKHGATGAATSISHWTDPVTGKQFEGFPYAVWTEGMPPHIKLAAPCTQTLPQQLTVQ